MKTKIDDKLLAVIRVRGRVGVRQSITETLNRLNLKRVNNLTILYGSKSNIGMIRKCNDFVTYGEVREDVLSQLLEKEGIKPTADMVNSLASGKKSFKELAAGHIRMHPPRHGYEGIKAGYSSGGSLGYRGAEINNLIKRMM